MHNITLLKLHQPRRGPLQLVGTKKLTATHSDGRVFHPHAMDLASVDFIGRAAKFLGIEAKGGHVQILCGALYSPTISVARQFPEAALLVWDSNNARIVPLGARFSDALAISFPWVGGQRMWAGKPQGCLWKITPGGPELFPFGSETPKTSSTVRAVTSMGLAGGSFDDRPAVGTPASLRILPGFTAPREHDDFQMTKGSIGALSADGSTAIGTIWTEKGQNRMQIVAWETAAQEGELWMRGLTQFGAGSAVTALSAGATHFAGRLADCPLLGTSLVKDAGNLMLQESVIAPPANPSAPYVANLPYAASIGPEGRAKFASDTGVFAGNFDNPLFPWVIGPDGYLLSIGSLLGNPELRMRVVCGSELDRDCFLVLAPPRERLVPRA